MEAWERLIGKERCLIGPVLGYVDGLYSVGRLPDILSERFRRRDEYATTLVATTLAITVPMEALLEWFGKVVAYSWDGFDLVFLFCSWPSHAP
jgi:hypothetical protein